MEDRTPFTHENGSTSTPLVVDEELFAPARLAALAGSVETEAKALGSERDELARSIGEDLGQVHAILRCLQEPITNTTLAAFKSLQPSEQAILNQVALALLDAGKKPHKLILGLRKAMDDAT